ncbi:hypothetical protein [Enterobacter sp. RHBSTW-00593]|uniref:hypothetical protein n=1 Tax=Enterobacter sp. RHBSTW-00593 TaxID=2742656 RepID=UPI0015E9DE93|nr:hypothetical protein [Enterobacter sp. RHBSTW-00593]QLX99033.1 hypothetical protein HV242_14905 [Enterobacter sp. RHBSTW-00593]
MAQEARREEYQIELRNADHSAKLALDAQELIVSDLTELYSTFLMTTVSERFTPTVMGIWVFTDNPVTRLLLIV